MNYNPQHISFLTKDNLKLPALLYTPERKTKKIALFLHGNGSSGTFYSPTRITTFAHHLNNEGIAFFPFNNRGAHYIMSLKKQIDEITQKRVSAGMTYELIKDCIFDIDGAIEYLKSRGYETFYVIGMSTGANKIVTYNFHKPKNEIEKYVLMCGGDDTGLYYKEFGEKKFSIILKKCKEMIEKGKGMNIVPKKFSPYFPMSYQSLYDTINPEGDYNCFPFNEELNNIKLSKKELFKEYKKINKQTLVIYGDQDEYCYGEIEKCVTILKKKTEKKDNFTYEIIPEADHGFTGKDEQLSSIISKWLKK